MFSNAFGWPHLIVILVVVLILFGAPKLPGLARSIGQSMRIFRNEVKTMKDDGAEGTAESSAADADDVEPQATSTPKSTKGGSAKPKS